MNLSCLQSIRHYYGGVILANTNPNQPQESQNTQKAQGTPAPKKKRKKKKRTNPFVRFLQIIGTLILIGVVTGAIMACFATVYIQTEIMPQSSLDVTQFSTSLSSTIYYTDEYGQDQELVSLYGTENRVWITYDGIPKDLINATIAIEDKRFLTHSGVDWIRTAYGVIAMFTGQDIQGGSTITQQLIKNMTDYDDVTVKRKIIEIFRALEFDKNNSKDTIMEMYLNYIYLGEGCYGIYTAAATYFDKEVSELTLAECASLIAITNNPSIYSPYSYDGEYNKERQELILYHMLDQELITQEEYDEAMAEELVFARGDDEVRPTTIFSWYEEQVITDVTNDLMEQYGLSASAAYNVIYYGGLEIYSNVDLEIQAIVEEVYEDETNLDLVSATGQDLTSAIVIVDADGKIVALAGNTGEKEGNRLWNMASDTVRQPGSAIKPLSVYAPALEMGIITPYSVYDDTAVRVEGSSAWPSNSYSAYYGRMTIYNAVRVSSNAVALRVLQDVTPESSYEFMTEKFHFTSLEEGRESWGTWVTDIAEAPLSMGGLTDGVSVLEMAAAYSTFPREGIYVEPTTYSVVKDAEGNIILDNSTPEQEAILSEETAWYINHMLEGVVTSTGTGRNAYLEDMTYAGKTGSTNSNNDRWFVGYTAYYTAAVWSGYPTAEAISYGSGYDNPSVDMWNLVMQRVHEGLEDKAFETPDGLITASYCLDSGMIPDTNSCSIDMRGSRIATGYYFSGDQPTQYCNLHETVEVCTECGVYASDGVTLISGIYGAAGPYCSSYATTDSETGEVTSSTVKTVSILNYDRTPVAGERTPTDYYYLKANWEAASNCIAHSEEPVIEEEITYDPATFDWSNPDTWPPADLYPYFDVTNPTTWPTLDFPSTDTPETGDTTTEPDTTTPDDDSTQDDTSGGTDPVAPTEPEVTP